MVHHHFNQLLEGNLRRPTQFSRGLAGISEQRDSFVGSEGRRILPNVRSIIQPDSAESVVAHLPDRIIGACRNDKIAGRLRLQHLPHGPYIVTGVAPVATRFEIAKQEVLLKTKADGGGAASDLATYEADIAKRTFMVV